MKEITGDAIHLQAKKIANLRAGDKDRDTVGEADDDRPWKIFHHGAHAGHAQQDEENARHHRAHEQAVDPVLGDDSCDHHDERPRWPPDLSFRATQRRDQEACDNGAIQARLR